MDERIFSYKYSGVSISKLSVFSSDFFLSFHLYFYDRTALFFFFSSRRRHTRWTGDWSSDVCSSDLVFGAKRDLTIETAIVCATCTGAGTAPGTHPDTCEVCKGRGEISQVTRSFLGQVMTSRPCPRCAGVGTVIRHPCSECAGDGRVRARRTLEVAIPAGVEHGMRIRLTGEGEVGTGGGPAGDLYVEIEERKHPTFERHGTDLHAAVHVPMTAAILGTSLTLDTLDGPVDVDVKPGTQPGTVIPLKGRGVPRLRSNGRGDLHVHLDVETPTKLDAEQEELVRKLATLRGEEFPQVAFKADAPGLFGRIRRS